MLANNPISKKNQPTSQAAEKHINNSSRGKQQMRVLKALARWNIPHPTSRELAHKSKQGRHEVARRLPELETAGLVERSESRPCGLSGRQALTWRITMNGTRVLW
jgi:DNA-binding IclR family transcriptional regulator